MKTAKSDLSCDLHSTGTLVPNSTECSESLHFEAMHFVLMVAWVCIVNIIFYM